MKWIKSNIENFGGDSNQITIWGQSAGASSISVHLASIRSADLFNQVIVVSMYGILIMINNLLGFTFLDINLILSMYAHESCNHSVCLCLFVCLSVILVSERAKRAKLTLSRVQLRFQIYIYMYTYSQGSFCEVLLTVSTV